jgi:hypothetical protein
MVRFGLVVLGFMLAITIASEASLSTGGEAAFHEAAYCLTGTMPAILAK